MFFMAHLDCFKDLWNVVSKGTTRNDMNKMSERRAPVIYRYTLPAECGCNISHSRKCNVIHLYRTCGILSTLIHAWNTSPGFHTSRIRKRIKVLTDETNNITRNMLIWLLSTPKQQH
jgi:hypothetical protein